MKYPDNSWRYNSNIKPVSIFVISCSSLLTLLFSIHVAASTNTSSDGPWTTWRKANQLTVAYREIKNSDLIEIKAQLELTSSISGLLLFLQKSENIPQWLENASASEILLHISAQENISLTSFNAFWPIKARQMLVHSRYWQNPDLSVEVLIEDAREQLQADITVTDHTAIFVNLISASWHIAPIENKQLAITHKIIADPAGGIPQWLANRIALRAMWKTFKNIQQQVPNSSSQQEFLPGIIELQEN